MGLRISISFFDAFSDVRFDLKTVNSPVMTARCFSACCSNPKVLLN